MQWFNDIQEIIKSHIKKILNIDILGFFSMCRAGQPWMISLLRKGPRADNV